MAMLRSAGESKLVRPAARCLVGRAPHCHLILDDSDASREHAVIFHDERGWSLRDLSSLNGTFVDGTRVKDAVQLRAGSLIRFGGESSVWLLDDVGAPAARAISEATGRIVSATGPGLQLPGGAPCEAYISNQDGEWLLELSGEARRVSDGETLHLSDGLWRLELTLGDERPTATTSAVEGFQTHLSFKVSRDEERVELSVERGGRTHIIPQRSHTYLLLLLARARLEDQDSVGANAEDHGWVETKELARKMLTTSEQINVWIWRAREQLTEVDAVFAQEVVERRRSVGELRIGFGSLSTSTF